jgi:hypothetical protein
VIEGNPSRRGGPLYREWPVSDHHRLCNLLT